MPIIFPRKGDKITNSAPFKGYSKDAITLNLKYFVEFSLYSRVSWLSKKSGNN